MQCHVDTCILTFGYIVTYYMWESWIVIVDTVGSVVMANLVARG